ncbi:hypothetical protein HYFRA_00011845 [Hymenoscyphus fraxineus]|uniref:Uncharacterized protein n=1 Tax=Hymenoscyphus fraxineus TaxID=746836 RepID=A0A9N9PVY8_9HELO|nr:hypothetical protein HYFRA_00011845 [Hymenoscyphus fraxineus]
MDRESNTQTSNKPQRPTLHSRHTTQLPLLINELFESSRLLGDCNTSIEQLSTSGPASSNTTYTPFTEQSSHTRYSLATHEEYLTEPVPARDVAVHTIYNDDVATTGKIRRSLNAKYLKESTAPTEANRTAEPPSPSAKASCAAKPRSRALPSKDLPEHLNSVADQPTNGKSDVLTARAVDEESEVKSRHSTPPSSPPYTITWLGDCQVRPTKSSEDDKREVVVLDDVSYFLNRARLSPLKQTTPFHAEDFSDVPSSGGSSPTSEVDSCFSEESQDSDVDSLDGLDHAGSSKRQRGTRRLDEYELVSSDSDEDKIRGRKVFTVPHDTTPYFSSEDQSSCIFGFEPPNTGYSPIDKRDPSPNWTRIERLKTRHINLQKNGIPPAIRKRILYGKSRSLPIDRSLATLNTPAISSSNIARKELGLEDIAEEGTFGETVGSKPKTPSSNRYKKPTFYQHSQETSSDESGVLFMKAHTKTRNLNSRARIYEVKDEHNNHPRLDKSTGLNPERYSSEESQASTIVGETTPLLAKVSTEKPVGKGKQRGQATSSDYEYHTLCHTEKTSIRGFSVLNDKRIDVDEENDELIPQGTTAGSQPQIYPTDFQYLCGDQYPSAGSSRVIDNSEAAITWQSQKQSWSTTVPELEIGSWSSHESFMDPPRTPPTSPCRNFRKPHIVGMDPLPGYSIEASTNRLYYDPISNSHFGPMVEKAPPREVFCDWNHRYTRTKKELDSNQLPSSVMPLNGPFPVLRVNMARIDTVGSRVSRRQQVANIDSFANDHDISPLRLPQPRFPAPRINNGTTNESRGRTRTRDNVPSPPRIIPGPSSMTDAQNQRTTHPQIRRSNRRISFAPLPLSGRTRRTSVGFIYRRPSRRRQPRSLSPNHRFHHQYYLYDSSDSEDDQEPKIELAPVRKPPMRADTPPPEDEARPVKAISNQPYPYVHQLATKAGGLNGPMDLRNFMVPGAGAGGNGGGNGKKGKGKMKENGLISRHAIIPGPADQMPSILGTIPGVKPTKKGRSTRIYRESDDGVAFLKEGSNSTGSDEANMEDWHGSLPYRIKAPSDNDGKTVASRFSSLDVAKVLELERENATAQNLPPPTPPSTPGNSENSDNSDKKDSSNDENHPPSSPPPSKENDEPGKQNPDSKEKEKAEEPPFRLYINILKKDEIPLAQHAPTPSPVSPGFGSVDWGGKSEHLTSKSHDEKYNSRSNLLGESWRYERFMSSGVCRFYQPDSRSTAKEPKSIRAASLKRHLDATRALRVRAGMKSGSTNEHGSDGGDSSTDCDDSGYGDEEIGLEDEGEEGEYGVCRGDEDKVGSSSWKRSFGRPIERVCEEVTRPVSPMKAGVAIMDPQVDAPKPMRTLCEFGPPWGSRSDDFEQKDMKNVVVSGSTKDVDTRLSTIAEDDEDNATLLTCPKAEENEENVDQAAGSESADSLEGVDTLEIDTLLTISGTTQFEESQDAGTGRNPSAILRKVEMVSSALARQQIMSEENPEQPPTPWHEAWTQDMLEVIRHLRDLAKGLELHLQEPDESFSVNLWRGEWNDAFLQVVRLLERLSDHFVDACQERQLAEQEAEMRELDERERVQAREMALHDQQMETGSVETSQEQLVGDAERRGSHGWYDVNVRDGGLEGRDGEGLEGMDALRVAREKAIVRKMEEEIGSG